MKPLPSSDSKSDTNLCQNVQLSLTKDFLNSLLVNFWALVSPNFFLSATKIKLGFQNFGLQTKKYPEIRKPSGN